MKSSSRSSAPTLKFSEAELQVLRTFATDWADSLSETQQRQLKILLALAGGEPGSKIAARLGLTHSAVSNVIAKVRKHGVEAYLLRWKVLTSRAKREKESHRAPGQQGIDFLREWLGQSEETIETVVEILYLDVDEHNFSIVFGVVDASCGSSFAEAFSKHTKLYDWFRRKFIQECWPQSPWNRWSLFESQLLEVLILCTDGATDWSGATVKRIWQRPKGQQYGQDCGLFALCGGSEALGKLRAWSGPSVDWIPGDNFLPFTDVSELSERLRNSLKVVWEEWNGAGLLPWIDYLHDAVTDWSAANLLDPFCWEMGPIASAQLARQKSIHRYYHSAFGAVFELDARLRKLLPWREEFSMHSVPLRPRVEVAADPDNAGSSLIALHILPQLGLRLRIGSDLPEKRKFATKLRSNLRKWAPHLKFQYTNRIWGQSLGVRMLPSLLEGKTKIDPVSSCVLIPRHWVCPESSRIVESLSVYPESPKEGVLLGRIEDVEDSSYLLFYAPTLLAGVLDAYRRDWYGNSLLRLFLHHRDFVEDLKAQDPRGAAPETLTFRRFHPSVQHWCYGMTCKRPEIDAGMDYYKERAAQEHRDAAIASGKWASEQKKLDPKYGFFYTLLDLDADFLLLGLDKATRQHVDTLAKQWSQVLQQTVISEFSLQTDLGRKLILSTIDSNLRDTALKRWPEVESAVQDAIRSFGEGALRVTRYVVEHLQRQLARDAKLEPFYVETTDSVFKRWKALLGQHIRGTLLASPSEIELDEEQHAAGSPIDIDRDHDQIRKLIALLTEETDPEIASEFVGAAIEIDSATWREVIERIPASQLRDVVRSAVEEAYEFSLTEQTRELKETQVVAIFAKLRTHHAVRRVLKSQPGRRNPA